MIAPWPPPFPPEPVSPAIDRAVSELRRLRFEHGELQRRVQAIVDMPAVVFASDPKEREMLSKDVVVRVLTGRDPR